jgi:hypothetical protein
MLKRRTIITAAVLLILLLSSNGAVARIEGRLKLDHLGPIPLPFTVPGAALFTFPGDIVTGSVDGQLYPEAYVQLFMKNYGAWIATSSVTKLVRQAGARMTPCSLPIMPLDCRNQNLKFELIAALTSRQLPPGPLKDQEWSELPRTEPIVLTCANFDGANLRILEVGHRLVLPKEAVRVSHYEDVNVKVDKTPIGALVQLCVRPTISRAIWCQESARPLAAPAWAGQAFFGRIDIIRGADGRLQFRDAYEHFVAFAVVVRAPLPIRENGIEPDEWLSLRPLILKESDPVETTRAYRPGDVRIDILTLGETNDGTIRLASPAMRVDGGFKPLPGYQRTKTEIITLLTRQINETYWSVSGDALLLGDMTRWTISVANLNPQKGPLTSQRLAIAVLSDAQFPANERVTEDILHQRARSISDEIAYRLYERK